MLAGGIADGHVLKALSLVKHGSGFLGIIENVIVGLTANFRVCVHDNVSAGHAAISGGSGSIGAFGVEGIEAVHTRFHQLLTIEALIPKDDDVGSFVVEAEAFEFFGGVAIPHFLLILGKADLHGLTIGVDDREFKFAVLRVREECCRAKKKRDGKGFPEHGRFSSMELGTARGVYGEW